MQILGTCVSVENNVEIQKQAGGVYQGSRLAYRDQTGALKEQLFHANAIKFNPAIKTALSNLTAGDVFVMTKEKEGEFWNVKAITVGVPMPQTAHNASPATAKAGAATVSPKSTYETPEERAMKQIYIVRQSSITAAINYLSATKKAFTQADILASAKQFENYIFDKGVETEDIHTIDTMQSDEID